MKREREQQQQQHPYAGWVRICLDFSWDKIRFLWSNQGLEQQLFRMWIHSRRESTSNYMKRVCVRFFLSPPNDSLCPNVQVINYIVSLKRTDIMFSYGLLLFLFFFITVEFCVLRCCSVIFFFAAAAFVVIVIVVVVICVFILFAVCSCHSVLFTLIVSLRYMLSLLSYPICCCCYCYYCRCCYLYVQFQSTMCHSLHTDISNSRAFDKLWCTIYCQSVCSSSGGGSSKCAYI